MTRHSAISFVKSGIRIVGYICLAKIPVLQLAAVILVVSEIVGILEEFGAKY